MELAKSIVLICTGIAITARADTDALSFPPSTNTYVVGYVNGGAGWSFVPEQNLIITQVGFDNNAMGQPDWPTNAEVIFWDSTNSVARNFQADGVQLPAELDTNGIMYGVVQPIALWAGHQYFLTFDLQASFAGEQTTWAGQTFTSDLSDPELRPAQTAPPILCLGFCSYDPVAGFVSSLGTNTGLELGPTFRFQLAPRLEVLSIAPEVRLAWSTNVQNLVLETTSGLAPASWTQVTNSLVVSGDHYVLTNRADDSARWFRLRLR